MENYHKHTQQTTGTHKARETEEDLEPPGEEALNKILRVKGCHGKAQDRRGFKAFVDGLCSLGNTKD